MAQPAGAAVPTQQGLRQIFEFTRRKKWQDILLSELPDTVLFVLDVHRVIQYANPGATEALGWDVEEMVDKDVLDFINSASLIASFFLEYLSYSTMWYVLCS